MAGPDEIGDELGFVAFAARTYLAEAGEPPPAGAQRVHLTDSAYELPPYLARADVIFTRAAEALVSTRPGGGTLPNLVHLVSSGLLVVYETPADPPLRAGAVQESAAPEVPPEPVEPEPITAWIEVELLDQEHRPIANQKYRIVLPDGTPREGFLNGQGRVRLEGFDPGTCHVSFPQLRRPPES